VKELVSVGQKVVIVEKGAPLSQAFHILVKNNIYSAPVWNRTTGEYVGFLDLLDVITFIVNLFEIEERESKRRKSDDPSLDFDALMQRLERMDSQSVEKVTDLSATNPFHVVSEDDSLETVLQVFSSTGTHRIAVQDSLSAFPKLAYILTQSALIRWLADHLQLLGNVVNKTIKQLKLGLKIVISVSSEEAAIEAFKLMARHKITAVAIVSPEGQLLANLSAKDIKVVDTHSLLGSLYKSTLQYVGAAHEMEPNIPAPIIYCKATNTLGEIISRLAVLKRHRLYVVDESKRPVGLITLGDIVREILDHEEDSR